MTLRVHSELEILVDGGTAALLDALREAGSSDWNFRRSQVEAAVRFAAKIFGAGSEPEKTRLPWTCRECADTQV